MRIRDRGGGKFAKKFNENDLICMWLIDFSLTDICADFHSSFPAGYVSQEHRPVHPKPRNRSVAVCSLMNSNESYIHPQLNESCFRGNK